MKRTKTLMHWGTYEAEVADGRLAAMHPDPLDPDPSAIGQSIPGTIDDPVRIPQPMVRQGFYENGPASRRTRGAEPFVPVSWEEATRLCARELQRVRQDFGNQAIFGGSYGWASAGRFHHAQSQMHRFLNVIGGYTRSVNTHSHAALEVLLPHIIGNHDGMGGNHTPWPLLVGNTELFVAFGGLPVKNSQVSAGGVSQHKVRDWLRECRRAGTDFINIGPLQSDIEAELAAEWIAPRPNSDTALMLGLAYTLESEGLVDQQFLARCTSGYDRFRAYLLGQTDGLPKSAAWAGAITGLDPGVIEDLARRMASKRTMISMSWALQRAQYGEQPAWMVITLAAMLGQIGLPGGGFGFGYAAANRVGNTDFPFSWPALPQFRNPVKSFIPVARLADMLLKPGRPFDYDGTTYSYPDIRLVWWAGGNPFHHQQDLNKLVRAWHQPEVVIVNEPWWNAVARHADIVLPCTVSVERNDLGIAKAEPRFIGMKQVVQPFGQARNDYDILAEIAEHLQCRQQFTEGLSEMQWIERLYEEARIVAQNHGYALPHFDAFWEAGEFGFPMTEPLKVMLEDFREDPVAHPLGTPSGRIEIFSETIGSFQYDDCPGHATWFQPSEWAGGPDVATYPLHLVSNQPVTRLHSQMDNGETSRDSKIAGREPVRFNPFDAAERNISEGDIVRLFNDRGECLAGARISETVAKGAVQLATGAWFDPCLPGVAGTMDRHGNPNVLTLDIGTSKLSQGPTAHTTMVQAEKFEGQPPAVRAFHPPPLVRPAAISKTT